MTNKQKQLLLKDLCARLPYHVIVTTIKDIDTDEDLGHGKYKQSKFTGYINLMSLNIVSIVDDSIDKVGETFISNIKPYLRPMSSMTEEEKSEFDEVMKLCNRKVYACPGDKRRYNFFDAEQEDFLNKRHFDYRGLIEEGLALEAKEDMYKEK